MPPGWFSSHSVDAGVTGGVARNERFGVKNARLDRSTTAWKPMRDFVLASGEGGEAVENGDRELLRVRSEGRHVQLDVHVYRRNDGSLLPVAISASPLLIGGSAEGAVVVFRDITEEKSERLRIRRELDALTWVGRIREVLD